MIDFVWFRLANNATSPTASPMTNSSAIVQMSFDEWTRNVYSGTVWKKLNDKQAPEGGHRTGQPPPEGRGDDDHHDEHERNIGVADHAAHGTRSPPTPIAATNTEPTRRQTELDASSRTTMVYHEAVRLPRTHSTNRQPM